MAQNLSVPCLASPCTLRLYSIHACSLAQLRTPAPPITTLTSYELEERLSAQTGNTEDLIPKVQTSVTLPGIYCSSGGSKPYVSQDSLMTQTTDFSQIGSWEVQPVRDCMSFLELLYQWGDLKQQKFILS